MYPSSFKRLFRQRVRSSLEKHKVAPAATLITNRGLVLASQVSWPRLLVSSWRSAGDLQITSKYIKTGPKEEGYQKKKKLLGGFKPI